MLLSFVSFATVPRRKPFFCSRVFVPKDKQKIEVKCTATRKMFKHCTKHPVTNAMQVARNIVLYQQAP